MVSCAADEAGTGAGGVTLPPDVGADGAPNIPGNAGSVPGRPGKSVVVLWKLNRRGLPPALRSIDSTPSSNERLLRRGDGDAGTSSILPMLPAFLLGESGSSPGESPGESGDAGSESVGPARDVNTAAGRNEDEVLRGMGSSMVGASSSSSSMESL